MNVPHLFFQRSRGWKEKGSNVLKKRKQRRFEIYVSSFNPSSELETLKNKFQTFIFQVSFASALAFRCASARARARFFRGRSELGLFFQPVTASLWEDVNWRISQLVFPTGWC